MFAVAARHGWNDLALETAKECLKLPLRASDYDGPEELKYVPAILYQRLVQYHYRCGEAGRGVCKSRHWIREEWEREMHCSTCAPTPGLYWKNPAGIHVRVAHPIPPWFKVLLESMEEKFAVIPAPVDEPLLLMRAMDGAANCPSCRGKVQGFLPEFLSATLRPKITSEIAKVCC